VATNYGVGGSNPSLPKPSILYDKKFADVAELVDARDLGSRVFGVRVRVSPSVLKRRFFSINRLFPKLK
jgi:hypothetical protein